MNFVKDLLHAKDETTLHYKWSKLKENDENLFNLGVTVIITVANCCEDGQ